MKLWKVSVAVFKSETYRFLRLDRPTDEELAADTPFPDGFVHLPKSVTAEWVKQLVAEQLVTVRDRRGFSKLEWRQMRERNEALDCRVYARVAAGIYGLDRFSDRQWQQMEAALGKQITVTHAETLSAPAAASQPQAAPRAQPIGQRNTIKADDPYL